MKKKVVWLAIHRQTKELIDKRMLVMIGRC